MKNKEIKLNDNTFRLIGVTRDEFRNWCMENNWRLDRRKTVQEFFARVKDGRIVRDAESGKLINKHRSAEYEKK